MQQLKWASNLLFCISMLLCSLHAGAWSLTWHGTIANSALIESNKKQHETVIAYANVLSSGFPSERKDWQRRTKYEIKKPSANATSYQKAVYEMAWLAAWPDLIRNQKLDELFSSVGTVTPKSLSTFKSKTTSTWHYHNAFYNTHNGFDTNCHNKNRGKLYLALPTLELSLRDELSVSQRAVVFAFYIHLMADAHQPLHNISRTTNNCEHDRGGNASCFKKKGAKCSLNAHQFWDLAAFNKVEPIEVQPPQKSTACTNMPILITRLQEESKAVAGYLYPQAGDFNNAKFRNKAKSIAKQRLKQATSRTAQIMKCYLSEAAR